MSIQAIGAGSADTVVKTAAASAEKIEKPFMETLKESLSQINDLQKEADQSVSALASGKDQEIHQTMIAVEKAEISFQLMMQVRNKILTAYEEINRMQV